MRSWLPSPPSLPQTWGRSLNRSSVFKPLSPWPLAQRSWVQVLILLGKRSLAPEKEKTSIHDCLCLCKFCQVAFRRHISLRLFTQREFLQGVSSPLRLLSQCASGQNSAAKLHQLISSSLLKSTSEHQYYASRHLRGECGFRGEESFKV